MDKKSSNVTKSVQDSKIQENMNESAENQDASAFDGDDGILDAKQFVKQNEDPITQISNQSNFETGAKIF